MEYSEIEELFKLYCQSVAEIIKKEIKSMNIERTAYGTVEGAETTAGTYNVRKQGENVILENLVNCSAAALSEGDYVTVKYTGDNIAAGYISRLNKKKNTEEATG